MSSTARVRAQAKINLFLRILAREASGYHGLETLFARIELADEIIVRVNGDRRSVDCGTADVGPAAANLAFRAAAAYADAAGWPAAFEITIDKRIPIGGGLGGGSADAGAVLRSLNALSPHPITLDALLAIAASVGADVPFLTAPAPLALAWGRGDRMLELPPLPVREIGLVCFPFGVSSADAFRWVADSRSSHPEIRSASRLTVDALRSWDAIQALAGNDFEEPISVRHPSIAEVLREARQGGALLAELTGSGSTIIVVPGPGSDLGDIHLPSGATLLRTRTAVSVEDVRLTG